MSIASHVDFDQNIDYVMGGNARIYIVNNQLDEREDVSESSIMGKEGMQLYSISRRCISRQLHLMSIASHVNFDQHIDYVHGRKFKDI